MTEPDVLRQTGRTYVRNGTSKLSYFSGCDYYRLSSDPRTIAAARKAAVEEGLTVAASRLTTGNHRLFVELERLLCDFFEAQDALLVTAGYFGNLVVTQALAGEFDRALIDDRAHPSLCDAAQFLACPITQFAHGDPNALEAALQRHPKGQRVILLTDGMFSHNGIVAPLDAYLKVLPPTAVILVDDAHGGGVVGKHGRGSLEAAGVERSRIIQTGTLSKAFGSGGGFILGTRTLRKKIIERSRMFVGCTPVPLPMAAAALAAIKIILKHGNGCRKRLNQNAAQVRRTLQNTPWETTSGPGPIVPILPRTLREATDLNQRLRTAKILPPFIHYPGGPASGYFRFVISSEHTPRQIAALTEAINEFVSRWHQK